jgi:3-dehydroquinate synthase
MHYMNSNLFTDYNIHFAGQEQECQAFFTYKRIVLIADARTNGFCVPLAKTVLPVLQNSSLIVVPTGEENKTLETTQLIWQEMQRLQVNKNCIVVIVGGGVLLDMAGFAASTYMRGIPFCNIPTTVLAMVDASVGGKTGINFLGTKNNIGAFTHPEFTYINPFFLQSLPQQHIGNGVAECIKHALLSSAKEWENCKRQIDFEYFISNQNIKNSISTKLSFVQQDPTDKGIRQALNFGHTFGHAIEAASFQTNKPLLHGEAILIGMQIELWLSHKKYNLSKEITDSFEALVKRLYPSLQSNCKTESILHFMQLDKKNDSAIRCTILKNIGEPLIQQSLTLSESIEALTQCPYLI